MRRLYVDHYRINNVHPYGVGEKCYAVFYVVFLEIALMLPVNP